MRRTVWAPRAGRAELVLEDGERLAMERAGGRLLPARERAPGAGPALPGEPRRRARAARPPLPVPARRGRGRLGADRRGFAWTDAGWSAPPLREAIVYELHVGTFSPEGTFERRGPAPRPPHRPGGHRRRADAGRRVPRPVGVGLRRGEPLRRPRRLWRPRRAAPAGRRLPPARPRGDPRHRLQPPGPGRQPPRRVRPLLHRRVPDPLGVGGQLRRPGQRRGPRLRDRERAAVAARLPPRRPAPRRGARHPRRVRPAHRGGAGRDGRRPGGRAGQAALADPGDRIATTRGGCGPGPGAGGARPPTGPTTSTTRSTWP